MTTGIQKEKSSDRFIPWYIVAFFVAQTILFGWFTYIAEKTYTGVVTDQAYEKGLAYNDTIKKAQVQEALGYASVLRYDGGKIIFSLKDRSGHAVAATKVTGILFRPVHNGIDTPFEMKDTGGIYTIAITPPEPGLWEVRVKALTPEGEYQSSQRVIIK